MLREQQRECAALHRAPLFIEFRRAAQRQAQHAQDNASDAQGGGSAPCIDDLDAGKRKLHVIRALCHRSIAPLLRTS